MYLASQETIYAGAAKMNLEDQRAALLRAQKYNEEASLASRLLRRIDLLTRIDSLDGIPIK